MPKYKRTVNKNLLLSLIKYNGHSFASLGKVLKPPLTRSVVCRICDPDHPHKPEKRILEISELFHVPHLILFPFVPVNGSKTKNQDKSTDVEVS